MTKMAKKQVANHYAVIVKTLEKQGVAVYVTDTNTVYLLETGEILFRANGHEIEDLDSALKEWCKTADKINGLTIAPY